MKLFSIVKVKIPRNRFLNLDHRIITFQAIFNGLIEMGLGFDAQILSAGVLLGVVVLAEAYALYKQALRKGERPFLLREAEALKAAKSEK